MRDKDRFVDELLDSALAHHRTAEPRPGLEARLLERARAGASEQSAGGNIWKLWIAAAATVAVAIMFFAIRVANRPHSPAAETSQASKAVPAPTPKGILTANSGAAPKAGNAISIIEPKRAAHRESKPSRRVKNSSRQVEAHHWPSQFPTPAPLTPEQKALVQYVRDTPPQVLEASLFKQKSEGRPMEIRSLKIAPLEIQPLSVGSRAEELQ
ncbi:MAG TPA: hypothetical protein VFQ24_06660 [Terriglobia bacterium]|nr:hypothetical protein [Terriglobia bacterium]